MPALKTFANLWTLWDHPGPASEEWSMAEKVRAVRGAGFDGVMGDPGCGIGALAREHRMAFLAFLRLDGRHDFPAELARGKAEGAAVVQVHLGWHDTPHEEALRLGLQLHEASKAAGIAAVIETHRDTCTETPEKTVALQHAFKNATGAHLPLLLDFSHHAIVKHLDPPYAARLLDDHALVQRTSWHHLRPFNGHHAQIAVTDASGSLTPEMSPWLDFAREIFALLRSSPLPEVWVCPEIGPIRGGYGLSIFPPAWHQAVRLREILVREWEKS